MGLLEFSRGMNYVAGKEVVTEENQFEVLEKVSKAYTEWIDSLDGKQEGEVRTVITVDGINYTIIEYFSKDGEPQGFDLDVSAGPPKSEVSKKGKKLYTFSVSATINTDIYIEAENMKEAKKIAKQKNFKGYFALPEQLRVNSILDGYPDESLPEEAVKTWEYRPSSDRV